MIGLKSRATSSDGMPRIATAAAVGHVRDRIAQRGRVAGHLEGDIEALDHPEVGLDVGQRPLARVDDDRCTHLFREVPPEGVRLADDDVSGAGVADDSRRHQPDRSGADDEHVLAQDREGEGRVDGVAERVEDRGDLLVDPRPVVPDVRHRQHDLLGERAVASNAQPDRVGAEVPAAGEAMAAAAADDVAFAAHDVARVEVGDVAADLDDLADELMADDERRLDRPLPPTGPTIRCEGRCRRFPSCERGSGRR